MVATKKVVYKKNLWIGKKYALTCQTKIEHTYPNPDKPELKIEDCKLNICGCRFAPSFFKWKEFLKYSLFNQKYSIVSR